MSKEMDEMREKITEECHKYLPDLPPAYRASTLASKFLSLETDTCRIAVVRKETQREFYDSLHKVEVEVPEGFVQEVKDE